MMTLSVGCRRIIRIAARYREQAAVSGAALLAAVGFALLVANSLHSQAPAGAVSGVADSSVSTPPIVYARAVCSLSNGDARASMVQGADGGASIVVGDKTWWLFGDTTFLPESGKQIEQNALASSTDAHDGGCPELHYFARNGIAVPFVPKDGSLTVWPAGAWPIDDHSFAFYTA